MSWSCRSTVHPSSAAISAPSSAAIRCEDTPQAALLSPPRLTVARKRRGPSWPVAARHADSTSRSGSTACARNSSMKLSIHRSASSAHGTLGQTSSPGIGGAGAAQQQSESSRAERSRRSVSTLTVEVKITRPTSAWISVHPSVAATSSAATASRPPTAWMQ